MFLTARYSRAEGVSVTGILAPRLTLYAATSCCRFYCGTEGVRIERRAKFIALVLLD